MGSGVTVQSSESFDYLSNAYKKTKQWFRSTDGSAVNQETGPPPPSAQQPSKHQPLHPSQQMRAKMTPNPDPKSLRMNNKDYAKAIRRLKSSLPDLKKKWGKEHIEVGETYYTIAAMYELRGNKQEARENYQQALIIFASRLGNKHPKVWSIEKKIEAHK
jgi:tetratricopeptide (TPR) repeat protein